MPPVFIARGLYKLFSSFFFFPFIFTTELGEKIKACNRLFSPTKQCESVSREGSIISINVTGKGKFKVEGIKICL